MRAVLLEGIAWAELAPLLLWTLLASAVFVVATYPWLKGKLDFARN